MAGLIVTRIARLALTALAACTVGGDTRAPDAGDTQAVESVRSTGGGATQATPAQVQAESFEHFWLAFRRAILTGDKEKIVAVTRFPFETRGPMDEDPVKTYDRAQFLTILDRLLEQAADEGRESETLRQYIERTTTLPERTIGSDGFEAHVGSFSFMKIGGQWRFRRAYTNE